MYYMIFEICVLLTVCYAVFRVTHNAPYLRLTAIYGAVLLTLALLQLHNLRHHASVIFNSPLSTLVCVNYIIVLTFIIVYIDLLEELLEIILDFYEHFWVSSFAIFTALSCVNLLILNVYMFIRHCDFTGSLFGKVSSGYTDYFFVSALLPTAFCISSLFLSFVLTGVIGLVIDVCRYLPPLYDPISHLVLAFLKDISVQFCFPIHLLVSGFSGSILVTWLAYDKVSSYDASTLVYLESVLERYYFAVAIPFAVLVIYMVYKRHKHILYLLLLAAFNMVITAAVMGCVLTTPLSEQAVPSIPLPEQDGYCAAGDMECMSLTSLEVAHHHPPMQTPPPQPEVLTGNTRSRDNYSEKVPAPPSQLKLTTSSIVPSVTPLSSPFFTTISTPPPKVSTVPPPTSPPQRCQEIDRNDQQAIYLGHLVHLQYLDDKDQRHELRIINAIAASWKKLGMLFNYDVHLVAQNQVSGTDFAVNCCQEVLIKWFNNGGARGYPLSWNGLINALRAIELGRVAGNIETALKCVIKKY